MPELDPNLSISKPQFWRIERSKFAAGTSDTPFGQSLFLTDQSGRTFQVIEMRTGIHLVFPMFEASASQYEGQVSGGMPPRSHSAAIKDGGMVKQGASVDWVLLFFQEVDQVRHHGNLEAFDLLQGGNRFLALPVVGEPVVTTIEVKVPVGETAHASYCAGRVGLDSQSDDLNHGLELFRRAIARFGFVGWGLGLGSVDPGFLLLNFTFQGTNRIKVLLQLVLILLAQFTIEGFGLIHHHVKDTVVALETLGCGNLLLGRVLIEHCPVGGPHVSAWYLHPRTGKA